MRADVRCAFRGPRPARPGRGGDQGVPGPPGDAAAGLGLDAEAVPQRLGVPLQEGPGARAWRLLRLPEGPAIDEPSGGAEPGGDRAAVRADRAVAAADGAVAVRVWTAGLGAVQAALEGPGLRSGEGAGVRREGRQAPRDGAAPHAGEAPAGGPRPEPRAVRPGSGGRAGRSLHAGGAGAEILEGRGDLALVLGVPQPGEERGSALGRDAAAPCAAEDLPKQDLHGGRAGRAVEAGVAARASAQLRDAPSRARRGHPHGAGFAWTQGSEDDADLHARDAVRRGQNREST